MRETKLPEEENQNLEKETDKDAPYQYLPRPEKPLNKGQVMSLGEQVKEAMEKIRRRVRNQELPARLAIRAVVEKTCS